MRFVIIVASTDSFKTLTTDGCLFLSISFLAVDVSSSSRAVSGATEGVVMGEAGKGFSLTGFHSPNQTFLGAAYSLFFFIRRRNIRLTGYFADFLAGLNWFVLAAKTPVSSMGV